MPLCSDASAEFCNHRSSLSRGRSPAAPLSMCRRGGANWRCRTCGRGTIVVAMDAATVFSDATAVAEYARGDVACVDLFCGAGGLTHSLRSAGVRVVGGVDSDEACRWAYERNNPGSVFHGRDIADVRGDDVGAWLAGAAVRVLAGCAPCQPFSTYTQRRSVHDGRWALLGQFGRLVAEALPDVVVMENVPALRKHRVFADFLSVLDQCGYAVWHDVVDCADYGLAQRRMRVVLLASSSGLLRLPGPGGEAHATVRDVISGLPPLCAGGRSDDDPVHAAARLSPLNLRRIRASHPGGTWRDWPDSLLADCHRKSTGATYRSVYGRMAWDGPAPTLTTQFYGYGTGRYGHPDQDRALSLREGALLQGFPPDYVFVPDGGNLRFSELGRLIGNAVPFPLGQAIGGTIVEAV